MVLQVKVLRVLLVKVLVNLNLYPLLLVPLSHHHLHPQNLPVYRHLRQNLHQSRLLKVLQSLQVPLSLPQRQVQNHLPPQLHNLPQYHLLVQQVLVFRLLQVSLSLKALPPLNPPHYLPPPLPLPPSQRQRLNHRVPPLPPVLVLQSTQKETKQFYQQTIPT